MKTIVNSLQSILLQNDFLHFEYQPVKAIMLSAVALPNYINVLYGSPALTLEVNTRILSAVCCYMFVCN